MRVRLIVPQVKTGPSSRPRECPHCHSQLLHTHQRMSRKLQSKRLQALATILWGLGLSLSWTSGVLEAFGAGIGKTTVWRDVQEAGEALRGKRRWCGKVRVLGADETVFKVWGEKVEVGFVVDGEGELIGFDVLPGRDAMSFLEWLRGYVEGLGVEVVVTDDLGTFCHRLT